jgi:hypothetical protein
LDSPTLPAFAGELLVSPTKPTLLEMDDMLMIDPRPDSPIIPAARRCHSSSPADEGDRVV